ncbi:hypothetical protein C8R45DRAFT_932051 [Mycena sanguinolenta]|nr:hypothetical protein C8R45DRAFT_932051 [Mycena sanguinolenta]
MFQLLLERSSIWEQLHINPTLIPPMTAFRERFPTLRIARVRWDDPESQTAVESIDFFRMATCVAEIAVHNRFRFLTRYDFDAPGGTHYELLKSLPNLRHRAIPSNYCTSAASTSPMSSASALLLWKNLRVRAAEVRNLAITLSASSHGLAVPSVTFLSWVYQGCRSWRESSDNTSRSLMEMATVKRTQQQQQH